MEFYLAIKGNEPTIHTTTSRIPGELYRVEKKANLQRLHTTGFHSYSFHEMMQNRSVVARD